jgi:hypothetical protein
MTSFIHALVVGNAAMPQLAIGGLQENIKISRRPCHSLIPVLLIGAFKSPGMD